MNISTTTLTPSRAYQPQAKAAATSNSEIPAESVSFSSDQFQNGLLGGAFGVIPVIGAGANFMVGIEQSFNGRSATAPVVGMFSNLIGTATTAAGLLTGSHTATYVGLGLLGVSGATCFASAFH